MLNSLILNGRLPHFAPTVWKEATDDTGAFLVWAISIKEEYKKKDAKYLEEFLVKFKASGSTATFIMNNFKQGDGLILNGRIDKEANYIDPATNQEKQGGLIMTVKSADFAEGNRDSGTKNQGTPNKSNSKAAPAGRPSPAGRPAPIPGRPMPGNTPGVQGGRPAPRSPLGLPPLGR